MIRTTSCLFSFFGSEVMSGVPRNFCDLGKGVLSGLLALWRSARILGDFLRCIPVEREAPQVFSSLRIPGILSRTFCTATVTKVK